jgi:hypothetical protein
MPWRAFYVLIQSAAAEGSPCSKFNCSSSYTWRPWSYHPIVFLSFPPRDAAVSS